MAVTKIISVKINVPGCIQYVVNEDKTENKQFVSCYGCTEETAATIFDIANSQKKTFRSDQKPVLAYHLVQSFSPDDPVTPEQAHEIGQKYMEELFGGSYAYVMSTHLDKQHTHNHFIVCASKMDMSGKKLENNREMIPKMRKASDKLCEEYGLSVIRESKGQNKHYKEWLEDKTNPKTSKKTQVKSAIDTTIKQSDSWEQFLANMKAQGIEISQGNSKKYGTVTKYKLPGSDRNIRGYSLGERYTDAKIKERIENRLAYMEQRRKENAERKAHMTAAERVADRNILKSRSMHDLTQTDLSSDNQGLVNWQRHQNELLFSQIMSDAQEKYGLLFTDFDSRLTEIQSETRELQGQIASLKTEEDILRQGIHYSAIYNKEKIIHRHYMEATDQEAYFQSHDAQLLAFDHAELNLIRLGAPVDHINHAYIDKMKSTLSNTQSEIQLLEQRLMQLKKEQADVEKWKVDVDIYLGKTQPEKETEKHTVKAPKRNSEETL